MNTWFNCTQDAIHFPYVICKWTGFHDVRPAVHVTHVKKKKPTSASNRYSNLTFNAEDWYNVGHNRAHLQSLSPMFWVCPLMFTLYNRTTNALICTYLSITTKWQDYNTCLWAILILLTSFCRLNSRWLSPKLSFICRSSFQTIFKHT